MKSNPQHETPHDSRAAVVGAGAVGTAFAYAAVIRGTVRELALLDINEDLAEGEALDLRHSLALLRPMKIESGGYDLCAGADVVIVTAGAAQKEGESRLDLASRNTDIVRGIIPEILKRNPSPVIIMVTNPVDVLTWAALKESGLPKQRVIGSGTVLDSSRFRYLLSYHCGLDPRNIHAYIIGEHGDSEVAPWSRVNVAGTPLLDYCPVCRRQCEPGRREDIVENVRTAAYRVIEKKGHTAYAIGMALDRIVRAVINDEKSVLTVSSLLEGEYGLQDVCLSLPTVVGAGGAEEVLHAPFADHEVDALRESGRVIKESIDRVRWD